MDESMRMRDIESRLPPGFRFHPSDEELVCYYLRGKVASQSSQLVVAPATTMVEVDLHVREPWELPEAAKLSDKEWYFFSFRDRKYATGSRTNRATKHGYWKATGKDKLIHDPAGMMMTGGRDAAMVIGMRKTLVFHFGRAPNGRKSDWVMHEFRLATTSASTPPKEDWVLCRVFHKGKGEAQHGGCSNVDSIGPGSWPAALCSTPQAADNLGGQLFPISVSSPIISSGPRMGDDHDHQDPAMLQQAAAADAIEVPELTRAAVVDGEMDYGENCIREMDTLLPQGVGNYVDNGFYF